MMNSMVLLVTVLLVGEVAVANRARTVSRLIPLLGIQQMLLATRLPQLQRQDTRTQFFVTTRKTVKPDDKARRNRADSPDDPNYGRPKWDEQKRRTTVSEQNRHGGDVVDRGRGERIHNDI